MTPDSKRAAGKGVVGYIRVSSASQVDGWSLDHQRSAIREWAMRHALPLIAIEEAPEGNESGATAFDDRAGWQAVERHIATSRVGWIAVSAIDRLSRDIGDLADRMRSWDEHDIAIVAPAQGYEQLEGIGPLMLHIWGAMADHERKRLLGRVLPGMQARLHAGLPLGTQPYGYQIARDLPVAGQRPRRHLVPDPTAAPVIAMLFHQALTQPDWGDRRMASWAAQQWPTETWSPGRIAKILANPIYVGILRSSVNQQATMLVDNHPPIVSVGEYERVQSIRAQRKHDLATGLNAVHTSSWLGGIVRCGVCGGAVTWRSFTADPGGRQQTGGQYYCTGAPTGTDGTPGRSCGAIWHVEVENFVWRAIEILVEREAGMLRRLVSDAVDQLPRHLDERRKRAAAELAAIDVQEVKLTDALADGSLVEATYCEAIQRCHADRAAAMDLLTETDGWIYLSHLITVREGEGAGRIRWITLQESRWRLSLSEQRRLLRLMAPTIMLEDPRQVGSLDSPAERADQGRFTGVTFHCPQTTSITSVMTLGMARMLVSEPGHDLAGGLKRSGWVPESRLDGSRSWALPHPSEDPTNPVSTIALNHSVLDS